MEEEIFNVTFEELDEVVHDHVGVWYFFQETFIFLVGLISITLNFSIAFCIFKFKGMQNRLNLLINSICIINIFIYLFNPEFFILIRIIFGIDYYYWPPVFCYVYALYPYFITFCSTFIYLITLDYVLIKISLRLFKQLILTIWLILLIGVMINTGFCICDTGLFPFFLLLLILFLFLIIVRYIIYIKDVIRRKVEKDYHYRMTIAGVYILSILLKIFSDLILFSFHRTVPLYIVFVIIDQIYFFQPIIFILLLIFFDQNFKMCLRNMYNCKYNYIEASITYKTGLDDENVLMNNEFEATTDTTTDTV